MASVALSTFPVFKEGMGVIIRETTNMRVHPREIVYVFVFPILDYVVNY